ncbi:MAG: NUDIX domain-containing protein [Ruminiclostridium sp.]|nr:NUDIX domain-containing protein [Ruminiclostridium sp.]
MSKEELLDILDETGELTGLLENRKLVHEKGMWHRSVHVWFFDENKLLLQRRTDTKESFPGMYDASVAGHVEAGESCLDAAVRETLEELGIAILPEKLIWLGCQRLVIIHKERNFISREYNYIYLYRSDFKTISVDYDTDEISDVIWCDVKELEKELICNNKMYCVQKIEIALLNQYLNE